MSSLIVLQTKENIVFASDTAISMNNNDKSIRVGNESKIVEYEDFLMFASGKVWLRDILLSNIPKNPSEEDIERVLLNIILEKSEYYSLEVILAYKDLTKVVFFSSTDGFVRSESTPEENIKLFTAGYKTEEIASLFIKNYNSNPLYKSLEKTYKSVSDEKVGGDLDVFLIGKKVEYKSITIDNMKCVDENIAYKMLDFVHAERIVGRLIIGQKLIIEDENGVWETTGSTTTIYDENDIASMWIGQLENNCFGIRMDNRKHRINLSTCDGFKISKYTSGGLEDVLIADLEGNFWTKYFIHDTTKIKDSEDYFELDDNEITISDDNSDMMKIGRIPNMTFNGCSIEDDWGIVLKGQNNSNIFMTSKRGFAIDVGCVNKFRVTTEGNLYTQDIEANNLTIKSAKIGDSIIINDNDGIVLTSDMGVVSLDGENGFKITNGSEDVFYVGHDGKLYLKNVYTLPEDGVPVEDLDGSYISDLTVNRLKTLTETNRHDYIHIEETFMRFNTDQMTKMEIRFEETIEGSYPIMIWGAGSGTGSNNKGFMYKTNTRMAVEYVGEDSALRGLYLNNGYDGSVEINSPNTVVMNVGNRKVEITPWGILVDGSPVLPF